MANVDSYMAAVEKLSDDELMEELRRHDLVAGPVVETTRRLYQKKLAQAMADQAKGVCGCVGVVSDIWRAKVEGREVGEGGAGIPPPTSANVMTLG